MELLSDHSLDNEEQQKQQTVLSYSILNEAQIRQRQEDDIARVSMAISEPRASAIVLLRRFNWNLSKLFDQWFDDELGVRTKLGLFPSPVAQSSSSSDRSMITCGICFEMATDLFSASCGHPFCRTCWSKYITRSITEDGTGCLMLACPDPWCVAAVGEDMVQALAENHSDKEKFAWFLLRSYIEDSYLRRKIRWCPTPNCNHAADFSNSFSGDGHRNYEVSCRCSYTYCWNCSEEAHAPVSCSAAAEWLSRSVDESETTTWILVNTKACPKCKRPIEKSQGCNHMRCAAPCDHEFCWHCLRDWSRCHVQACNMYGPGNGAAVNQTVEVVRSSLRKHEHYYERWAGNLKSRRRVAEDLRMLKSGHLSQLGLNYGLHEDFLGFIVQAWEQIIKCRRILQWSYTYGYYFPDDQVEKKLFFEYLQREVEYSLEWLHECAEEELKKFLDGQASVQDFFGYRRKLSELTFAIGNYFDNFVNALEDGLPEVARRHWTCEICTFSNSFGTSCYMCCSICPKIASL